MKVHSPWSMVHSSEGENINVGVCLGGDFYNGDSVLGTRERSEICLYSLVLLGRCSKVYL